MIGMYFYKKENKFILQNLVKVGPRNLVEATLQRLSKSKSTKNRKIHYTKNSYFTKFSNKSLPMLVY